MNKGILVFFCGKMGAGKSTKAREMARSGKAVLVSEDEWLQALYPRKISSLDDYLEYSALLKAPMKQLVQSVLSAGTDVVMDFPANTLQQRKWFKSIFTEIQAPHRLIYIEQSDETCLRQIANRRIEQPERAETDTPEMFDLVTRYFVAPSSGEGFNMQMMSGETQETGEPGDS